MNFICRIPKSARVFHIRPNDRVISALIKDLQPGKIKPSDYELRSNAFDVTDKCLFAVEKYSSVLKFTKYSNIATLT